jgi:hypothetical protein
MMAGTGVRTVFLEGEDVEDGKPSLLVVGGRYMTLWVEGNIVDVDPSLVPTSYFPSGTSAEPPLLDHLLVYTASLVCSSKQRIFISSCSYLLN